MEIGHIDISGPFTSILCGDNYFVIFIEDFSHYGYLYLIKENFDAFEKFKTEVEKQLEKVISRLLNLIEVVIIMENMVQLGNKWDHLPNTCKSVGLSPIHYTW